MVILVIAGNIMVFLLPARNSLYLITAKTMPERNTFGNMQAIQDINHWFPGPHFLRSATSSQENNHLPGALARTAVGACPSHKKGCFAEFSALFFSL
jgi:hypothetical protein